MEPASPSLRSSLLECADLRRRHRLGRWAAIGLMALGGVTLFLSLLWGLAQNRLSDPTAEGLPPSLAGLALRSAGYGAEAVAEVTRLHRKEFPLTTGAVGYYGPQDEVTVWVAGTLSGLLARAMLNQMQESIAEGGSPFTLVGVKVIDGRSTYELTGMGQVHYYFQSGARLVWIAAVPEVAGAALREALAFYP